MSDDIISAKDAAMIEEIQARRLAIVNHGFKEIKLNNMDESEKATILNAGKDITGTIIQVARIKAQAKTDDTIAENTAMIAQILTAVAPKGPEVNSTGREIDTTIPNDVVLRPPVKGELTQLEDVTEG